MRLRLTFLLAALIALAPSVHAQRTSGGGRGGSVSGRKIQCRITVPLTNTGSTTQNYLPGSACKIPAGTLGANSVIFITQTSRVNSGGTGTCAPWVYLATTSGALTTQIGNAANVGTGGGYDQILITNVNSTSSQNAFALTSRAGGINSTPFTAAFNTATSDLYINTTMQNSVGTDTCSLLSQIVEIIP